MPDPAPRPRFSPGGVTFDKATWGLPPGNVTVHDPGAEDGRLEPPVVAGSVTGYRWWTLTAPPDWRVNPLSFDYRPGLLHGMRAPWTPGVNCAVCLNSGLHGHKAAAPGCGCGYWAYWHPVHRDIRRGRADQLAVFGVIKGFGRTRIGTGGFRCEKARILAVHLAFTLMPFIDRHPGVYGGPQLVTRTMDDGRQVLLPRDLPYEQAERAVAHAEAWVAVIGDYLERVYPGVVVCETRDALLARFRPDPVYGRRVSADDWFRYR